jgi:hypothetical protein
MRTFWNVHTNGTTPDPTSTEIMAWINDATQISDWGTWATTTPYACLNATTPSGDINTNWDIFKFTHGINH